VLPERPMQRAAVELLDAGPDAELRRRDELRVQAADPARHREEAPGGRPPDQVMPPDAPRRGARPAPPQQSLTGVAKRKRRAPGSIMLPTMRHSVAALALCPCAGSRPAPQAAAKTASAAAPSAPSVAARKSILLMGNKIGTSVTTVAADGTITN